MCECLHGCRDSALLISIATIAPNRKVWRNQIPSLLYFLVLVGWHWSSPKSCLHLHGDVSLRIQRRPEPSVKSDWLCTNTTGCGILVNCCWRGLWPIFTSTPTAFKTGSTSSFCQLSLCVILPSAKLWKYRNRDNVDRHLPFACHVRITKQTDAIKRLRISNLQITQVMSLPTRNRMYWVISFCDVASELIILFIACRCGYRVGFFSRLATET